MRKIVKTVSMILTVLTLALMTATVFGHFALPDEVAACGDAATFYHLYTVTAEGPVIPVSANGELQTAQATVKLLDTIPVKNVSLRKSQRRYVALGGELIGLTLRTQGILVVGVESFSCGGAAVSPADRAGLKIGDAIVKANGAVLTDNASFLSQIEASDGQALTLEYIRNGKTSTTMLTPEKSDMTGQYKCGLWIRDCTNGIGTLTYTDIERGSIASLGHAIYDVDTNDVLPAAGGEFRTATLIGVTKGSNGAAGELKGVIGDTTLGTLTVNCEGGVYGDLLLTPSTGVLTPVAMPDEIRTGPAQIVATVEDGQKTCYDVTIEKIIYAEGNRNMVVKVTDPALLEITGGIVQGMSGSPIIQNGMLAGAITHVFLNDPQKGYGIFAENMLALSDGATMDEAA
ncbi:MAG: SpoIVB peptidase [Clostridia bacterium]|nr:SpoIVB peptidase [Clostridia bacterium]